MTDNVPCPPGVIELSHYNNVCKSVNSCRMGHGMRRQCKIKYLRFLMKSKIAQGLAYLLMGK